MQVLNIALKRLADTLPIFRETGRAIGTSNFGLHGGSKLGNLVLTRCKPLASRLSFLSEVHHLVLRRIGTGLCSLYSSFKFRDTETLGKELLALLHCVCLRLLQLVTCSLPAFLLKLELSLGIDRATLETYCPRLQLGTLGPVRRQLCAGGLKIRFQGEHLLMQFSPPGPLILNLTVEPLNGIPAAQQHGVVSPRRGTE